MPAKKKKKDSMSVQERLDAARRALSSGVCRDAVGHVLRAGASFASTDVPVAERVVAQEAARNIRAGIERSCLYDRVVADGSAEETAADRRFRLLELDPSKTMPESDEETASDRRFRLLELDGARNRRRSRR